MKSINIKGKDYITVNERLKHFRASKEYEGWSILEEVVEVNEKEGIFCVRIYNKEGDPISIAHAQEYRDNTYINKTSFLENGFTSALGRALGYLGIGIDASIASAQEMVNAVENQKDEKPWLNEAQLRATLKGTKEQAQKVLRDFRMKNEYRETINTKFKF
jgi:hypothetical protein